RFSVFPRKFDKELGSTFSALTSIDSPFLELVCIVMRAFGRFLKYVTRIEAMAVIVPEVPRARISSVSSGTPDDRKVLSFALASTLPREFGWAATYASIS